ncbi:MAG: DNA ligase [Deltaproteobacteria bacterium]|nr:MAG: DNA ligase [Deltaproteobacteria bacterium]
MFDRKIPPMLAQRADAPFDSDDHIYEIKWDGTRCLLFYRRGELRLQNRRLLDITQRYPELVREIPRSLPQGGVILDGELVVLRDGRPHFPSLQEREHVIDSVKAELLSRELPATYIAFDILYVEGQEVTKNPLMERKALLEEMVTESEFLILSRYVEKEGRAFYREVVQRGFEGAMAKRKDSPYLIGKRSRFWLKIKPRDRQICYIIGYTEGQGERKGTFGALILASREGEGWAFRGKVGSGFSLEDLERLRELLEPLRVDSPPIEGVPRIRGARWVKPVYRCEVVFQEPSTKGKFRAPVFRRLLK